MAKRPFTVFALYAATGALVLVALSWQNAKEIRETTTLKAAEAYSQSVSSMRSYYSKHVVPRARKAGTGVSTDYLNTDNTIPFPATLTIDLANNLRANSAGFQFNFYSNKPFPGREGRTLDRFEKDALAALSNGGVDRFVRYENFRGQRSVRVAYPVVMGKTCVSCHNSLPQSPFKNWKPGDVRGVQQITVPIPHVGASFIPDIQKSAIYVGVFVVAGLILIWLLLRELRDRIDQTRRLAAATEEKNLELSAAKHEAELANRAQGELIANVGHELRTPLNAIIGFSEILRDQRLGKLGNPEYREFADDIYGSGKQLLDIINSILEISKLEGGRAEMQQEAMSVHRAVERCLETVSAAATQKSMNIETVLPDDLPMIIFDRSGLSKILTAILDNAVKFSEPNGKISIGATVTKNEELRISVTDTGVGISGDMLTEILKPFRQADAGHTRRFEGIGLGLAMANAIAGIHGARLKIRSQLNVGTTVELTVPEGRLLANSVETNEGAAIAA